ncbi:hypothetical protein VMF7928_00092 [Vibrio marisflavi CECT 7928]|uniref:Uncharacterized protein n=1 Tax=Vibrio marisflavi CECT 7928 TaxID=634439 RepID=A0ABM8ZYT8_9VIBR|nr:hypothetical protein VMF7928_00092 [Vibrio marisflavi CECT 7928]
MCNKNGSDKLELKIYRKNSNVSWVCLGYTGYLERMPALFQWFTTKRERGLSQYFLVLSNHKDEVIDSKFISFNSVCDILNKWGFTSCKEL